MPLDRPVRFQPGWILRRTRQMLRRRALLRAGRQDRAFDRGDQAYTLWNTDVGPQESVDPLYKSIPFFLAINGTRSYGIFLDNTWRTWFDFGKHARDAYRLRLRRRAARLLLHLWAHARSRWWKATPISPESRRCLRCGRWASSSRVTATLRNRKLREIATRLRNDKIPSDVVYLDIDYQDRNRPFTVDAEDFPEFSRTRFRSAQAALSSGQHHRSAHRARPQSGILAVRHRPCGRSVREESRRQRVRRRRLAGARGVSRISLARRPASGGAVFTRNL